MGIVEQHCNRSALGVSGEQTERRGADREPLLSRPGSQRERTLQRDRLRLRDVLKQPQGRADQLEQRRERNLRFRLDPARAQQLHADGPLGGVVEQRCLADPGLAYQRERRARA